MHISPFSEDGASYGTPTWIWSVAVDGTLYVRGCNGQDCRWCGAATRQKAGRILAAGLSKEVTFEAIEGPINDLIDDAYRPSFAAVGNRTDDRCARPLRDHQDHAARREILPLVVN